MASQKHTSPQEQQGQDSKSKDRTTNRKKNKPQPSSEVSPQTPAPDEEKSNFPIVGIGASAGGLEAFGEFFTHMPSDSGMAFVLVQHLDPTHKSILGDLLKRYTSMKVLQVEDGMKVEPNYCYIIPPNREMAILHRQLHLIEPVAPRGQRLPIDFFFRSMAQDLREQAICIVLSGTGTDGTLGLKSIKGEAGMAMVQDPASARYNGMPQSAINTNMVDYILSPDKMPEQLRAYVRHAFTTRPQKATTPMPRDDDYRRKVYILLRDQTGHDFSLYKDNTIIRRIERRMSVNQINKLSLYVRYLQQNPVEVETLFRELLIGVTSFFRDPEAFETLRKKAIPSIFENSTKGRPLRVWVPGCSTGEEAYSIAILIQDYMRLHKLTRHVQVFATDIDAEAIETARSGIYPDGVAVDVPTEYLKQYFSREENTFQVNKRIRDMLVFASQSVIKDPPFSKLDLISCRNLLIYMSAELQRKLLPLFHYSLSKGGMLFLGPSETIGELSDAFVTLDRKWKLFQRKEGITPGLPKLDFSTSPSKNNLFKPAGGPMDATQPNRINLRDLMESTLLANYTPPCVIINEQSDILYVHGHTGKYLEAAQGDASLNLVNMARKGLKLKLTTAIRKVRTQKESIRIDGLQTKPNGESHVFDLILKPVGTKNAPEQLIMAIFVDSVSQQPLAPDKPLELSGEGEARIEELEQELQATKERLHTTIEELETSNEELTSTNEELQSSNEELQSTNEELETSKEELQSVNEELMTVNSELEKKVTEVSEVNNDMANLLASTNIGTLFLDNAMRILRFTPAVSQVANLIQSDTGRPLSDIALNLVHQDLAGEVKEVLNSLNTREIEVQSRDGNWYLMRIMPYRTTENVIEGAVITFVDITSGKQAEEKFRRLLEAAPDATVISNKKGVIVMVNKRTERLFGYTRNELLGQPVEVLVPEAMQMQHINHRNRYMKAPKARLAGEGLDLYAQRKDGSTFAVEITLSPIQTSEGVLITSAIRDISRQKAVSRALRRANRVLQTCGAWHRHLAKIDNEQQLYENMCRLVVETAGYARAWIGVICNDETKKLQAVAHAGFDPVAFDALLKEHDMTAQDDNPTCKALRSGHTSVASLAAQGAKAVQEADHKQEDSTAIVALPLLQDERVFGVLTIHSTDPYAFAEEECRFLQELSQNLSFGFSKLKSR